MLLFILGIFTVKETKFWKASLHIAVAYLMCKKNMSSVMILDKTKVSLKLLYYLKRKGAKRMGKSLNISYLKRKKTIKSLLKNMEARERIEM